ncbi:3-deoxy-D-manno-octulosonic acid transferase [Maridesulfovibrio hydrothermalis]|uniref:3-deoxy-D-manno-octulosonic acid transferase n=1 Tax=Maridesulfovibrio hydrothermalis AM13 = DSM 14728 TaxID=1121451 RepID=L0RB19_9BACT|nr:glycosyltransferase N-terminal domain-containing protein [Maridesulfovibrio hydrothermalis]CCO23934.1 Three-deoxy-D-manno-octulosonic-acid transferase domain protein [Maridesulfovibrio hydrothermalis AM13 = DSM 14728]
MSKSLKLRTASFLYNLGWKAAIPFLKKNERLREGFDRRTLKHSLPPQSDVWIQAASAGESKIVTRIMDTISLDMPTKFLLTTNTSQGLSELERTAYRLSPNTRNVSAAATYFPFDSPDLALKALNAVKPRLVVLIETEIWPGFLSACKDLGIKVIIINARMTTKSLAGYMAVPSFFKSIAPEEILAISDDDATRFKTLFEIDKISTMPNVKFDGTGTAAAVPYTANPLSSIFRPKTPFIILGSIRKEEESQVLKLAAGLKKERPKTVIGLFPRHMHRIEAWKKMLDDAGLPWVLRSEIKTNAPFGYVILWDVFGEMLSAFSLARAAFIGGSLAPVGGQNFLEPLSYGITPVIGPYWSNFTWVGKEIFEKKLARQEKDWKSVLKALLDVSKRAFKPEKVKKDFEKYLENMRGGTEAACDAIKRNL